MNCISLRYLLSVVVVFCNLVLVNFDRDLVAAPLPPSPGVYPAANAAGQTTLFDLSGTSSVFVDWLVTGYVSGSLSNSAVGDAPAPGPIVSAGPAYVYYYQLENPATAGSSLATLSINIPAAGANSILGAGILAGENLDLASGARPSHSSASFALLLGESEGATTAWATVTNIDNNGVLGANITWTDSQVELAPGAQSYALFYVSTLPPTYGVANVIDGNLWSTQTPGSDGIVVPVPEPSSFFAGAIAFLTAVGMISKRISER